MKFFSGKAAVAAVAALATLPNATLGITPEQLLAAPRRSAAVPNPSGEYALYTETTYSWTTHKRSTVWKIANLANGQISTWHNGSDISEVVWVGSSPTSILYVNGTNEADDGGISIYAGDALSLSSAYLVTSLPAPYSGLKAAQTTDGSINFLLNCKSYPNGTAYNEALATPALSSARIYTSIYVRHWDYYLDANNQAVFAGTFRGGSQLSLSGSMRNLVTGIKNVTAAESPIGPDFDTADYDISSTGRSVVFKTKNVDLPLANYTSTILYLVPHDGSSDAVPVNSFTSPYTPKNARGAVYSPVFSPDGARLAYSQMDGISYESDRLKLYVVNVDPNNFATTSLAGNWDKSPDLIRWSTNGTSLFVNVPDRGHGRVFNVPIVAASASADYKPANITDQGTVADFYVLPDDNVLVSDSKFYSSRDFYIQNSRGSLVRSILRANQVDPALQGLGPKDVSEFYFQGSWTQVQAFIIYPTNFDPSKKYPLAFLIHGGPQVQWSSSWSTRWNLRTWADQGYIVIAPNPSGTNAFGQAFTDSIANNWGSYPYEDLVKCWEWVNANLSFVDTSRGIAAGASYGGYMTNWIQGMPLGRKFKALVTHDGVTSTLNQYTSEELWFMQHDFNGTLMDARPNYERYNPINNMKNFSTPQLIIHNDLDYRLPVTEGIMMFNILQELGVPSKFLNFPNENHWVLNRENSLVWHQTVFGWINYYSGLSTVSPL